MTSSATERRTYLTLGLIALVATQATLAWHFASGQNVADFLIDAVATPAGVFAVADLALVAGVALVFMVIEGRRLGVRHLWVYVMLTFAVAISVAFPLFLVMRSRTIQRR